MSYTEAWLSDPSAIRAVFCEITTKYCAAGNASVYVDTPIYLSTVAYSTTDGAIGFLPYITGDVSFKESISKDGNVSISFGDLEVSNINGVLDQFLDQNFYVWSNTPISIYYGDPTWTKGSISAFKNDFLKIYQGVVDSVVPKTRDSLSILFRDHLERLNSTITENTLGSYGVWNGTQPNAASIKPLIFGEVFNITPMLIDPSTLEYQVHDGAIEKVIEIRDNGVPIYNVDTGLTSGATITEATGKFKLTSPPAGVVTCSVQGAKQRVNMSTGAVENTYDNTVTEIIALIARQYGNAANRLAAAELDLTNLSTFDAANTQAVGIFVPDRQNTLSVMKEIASSIGAQVFMGRTGKLQIVRYGVGRSDVASVDITESDIYYKAYSLISTIPAVGAVKLGYCKNWTVQSGLVSSIPEEHKAMLETEWMTSTFVNTSTATLRKLETDAAQKDTLLLTQTHADAEAQRLAILFSTNRYVLKFTGISRLFSLVLGQNVRVFLPRFNLSGGVTGQVISLAPNWLSNKIDVEVLI